MIELRVLRACDLPAVLAIQRACYGDGFVESAEVFARRLQAAPDTAWVMASAPDDRPCAYLSAYPSRLGQVTPLHGDFHPAGAEADTLYLHDLAVHPEAHGQRLGPTLVQHALAMASQQGWTHSALVAVQASRGFWQRQGYAASAPGDSRQQHAVAAYGTDALYMVRPAIE